MTIGGLLFIIGAALQAGAVHLAMLIVGRVMLGFGVGLANQVGLPSAKLPPHSAGDISRLVPAAEQERHRPEPKFCHLHVCCISESAVCLNLKL